MTSNIAGLEAINETLTQQAADLAQMEALYQPYDLYSMTQYPWWCLNYFFFFWLVSNLMQTFLLRIPIESIQKPFENLDYDKRNNVIIYAVQLLGTTIALIAQLYGSADIIFLWKETTTESHWNSMNFSIQLIAILYTWELIFRKKIGLPLLVHHLCTILLIQLATASFFDTHDILYIRFAILMGFHATVEQFTFVALFFFRLNLFENWQAFWFLLSTAQSLILKTSVTTVCVVYYVVLLCDGGLTFDTNWSRFWTISSLPLLACLYGAQLYACMILYKLGKRCQVAANFDVTRTTISTAMGTDEGATRLSKALFHEESVNLLTEYETNQQSLRGSSSHAFHPASCAPAVGSSMIAAVKRTTSDYTDPTPFQRTLTFGSTEGNQVPETIFEATESPTETEDSGVFDV